MPFKAPEIQRCPKCQKAVYAAEEVLGAGQKWHKMCFACGKASFYTIESNLVHLKIDQTFFPLNLLLIGNLIY